MLSVKKASHWRDRSLIKEAKARTARFLLFGDDEEEENKMLIIFVAPLTGAKCCFKYLKMEGEGEGEEAQ